MADASNTHHASLGQAFIKLRRDDGINNQPRYILVHSWWNPSLPITVFSPSATVERHKTQYKGYSTTLDHIARTGTVTLHSCLDPSHDVHLPGVKKRLLLYTALLVPSGLEHLSDVSPQITHLSARATQVLWHQRLNHCHARRVSKLHKHVDGIPKIANPPYVDGYDTCWACKMRKSDRGSGDTRRDATVLDQGVSMDFGFIVQRSNNVERFESFQGINGETSYLIVADHFTDVLWGIATDGKAPPISWLNRWFAQYKPSSAPFYYAAMDEGGEMAKNPDVLRLLEHHGYDVRPTAPDSSFQNAPGERPHQDIGTSLRAMLHGASLPNKCWPFAFYYHLLIHRLLPHGNLGVPHTRAGGGRGDLSKLRTFGCPVLVRPPGRRSAKLVNHVNRGIFLGYTSTLTQIYYFDVDTTRVKTAFSVKFDEVGVSMDVRSPSAKRLRDALDGHKP
jgi:hypothetical protein